MVLIGCLLQSAGCSTLEYLFHTSNGHLELMSKRQSIPALLEQDNLDEDDRRQLETVLRVRTFATETLLLPDNKSYTYYVELDRDNVTWVVFAAPELSLEPVTWCFWIVGCVPYRGYFESSRATEFAKDLRNQGFEVYIAPIAAYSTLGWFSDPVLSTMLNKGEVATAEYLIHELAHQKLYLKDDTNFNEAFASSVAQIGVSEWLRKEHKTASLERFNRSVIEKEQIYHLVQQLRQGLKAIYSSSISESEKRKLKQKEFDKYRDEVSVLLSAWPKGKRYQNWALHGLNNAKLNATSAYHELIPDFISLFDKCNKDYKRFYDLVASMERISKSQRQQYLRDVSCKPTGGLTLDGAN